MSGYVPPSQIAAQALFIDHLSLIISGASLVVSVVVIYNSLRIERRRKERLKRLEEAQRNGQ